MSTDLTWSSPEGLRFKFTHYCLEKRTLLQESILLISRQGRTVIKSGASTWRAPQGPGLGKPFWRTLFLDVVFSGELRMGPGVKL